MNITREELQQIIEEELEAVLNEKCQKGYKTHPTRKTKEMFGRTYRNCIKAEEGLELEEEKEIPGESSQKSPIHSRQRGQGSRSSICDSN